MPEGDVNLGDANISRGGARSGRWSIADRKRVAARRANAIELRLAGFTFEAIAERLDYKSRAHVATDINRALLQTVAAPAHELRELETRRIDRLQSAYWDAAMSGDVRAGQLVLRVMERRARMLNLDVPTTVDLTEYIRELADSEGVSFEWLWDRANEVVKRWKL